LYKTYNYIIPIKSTKVKKKVLHVLSCSVFAESIFACFMSSNKKYAKKLTFLKKGVDKINPAVYNSTSQRITAVM